MKSIFLTGASGVVGSALVPVLLRKYEGDIYFLLRAKDQKHLQQRFLELLEYWGFSETAEKLRLIPCHGDMTKPKLGMNESDYEKIIKNCTHIIHCGGVVRMNLSIEEARKAALEPAKEIVALAKSVRAEGKLLKIEYISTVGVIGKSSNALTEKLITEQRSFHNTYEQAKAETEEYLVAEINAHRLPITIHRPSMVVGDSITGKNINFQVFYHLCEFLSGKRTFGILPNLKGAQLDIIPADYVAEVIAWSVNNIDTIGDFIHECSGPMLAVDILDLEKQLFQYPYFSRYSRLLGKRNIHLPLSVFNILTIIFSYFSAEKDRKALKTLPHFLEYLSDPQIFEDEKTAEVVRKIGIKKPEPSLYLDTIIRFYQKAFIVNI